MGMNVVIFFLQIIEELKPRTFGGVNNIYLSKPFNAFCTFGAKVFTKKIFIP